MAQLPHVRPGDPIAADRFNAIAEQLERFANLSVAGRHLRLWSSPTGKCLALALPQPTWALLSGSTSPYSFEEVRDAAGGIWQLMPNGDVGTANVYEINGKPGLAGKVVPITWTAAGDWRFQWVGHGTPSCESGRVCVTIDSDGCSPATPVSGATVTVTDSAEPPNVVGTCLSTGTVTDLPLSNPGSGYPNGTGYPLAITGDGSGASGTFDVVAGQITNLVLLEGGSAYTSATISLPALGSGSGATASATVKARCCIAIPSAGTYQVTVHVPGATDRTATVNAVCNQDNHVSVSFPSNSLGTVCFTFKHCDYSNGEDSIVIALSGVSIATGATDSTGQCCFLLGAGTGYSYTLTTPGGATSIGYFSVGACGTEAVDAGHSFKRVFVAARTKPPAGCMAIVTVTDENTNEILGTGTLTTTLVGSIYFGETSFDITEIIATGLFDLGIEWAFPGVTVKSNIQRVCFNPITPELLDIHEDPWPTPC